MQVVLSTEYSYSKQYICKLSVKIYLVKQCYFKEELRNSYFEAIIVKGTPQELHHELTEKQNQMILIFCTVCNFCINNLDCFPGTLFSCRIVPSPWQ